MTALLKRRKGGYTLIEVLISVVIFSAIVTLACTALNQGLKQYSRLMETGINFWENAQSLWLNRSFSSMVDYYVFSKTDGWYPYFVGNEDMISYVTIAPFASDTPVVVWIIKERNDDGTQSIVYYELPVQVMKAEEIERAYIFNDYKKGRSIVLHKGVDDTEFDFYGYNSSNDTWAWGRVYNGNRTKRLPRSVNISYNDLQKKEKKMAYFAVNCNAVSKVGFGE
jgi:general secretion pathway protein J